MKNFYFFLKRYKVIHIFYWLYAGWDLWHKLVLSRGANYHFNKFDLVKDISLQILTVYLVIYGLIPRLYFKKRYLLFFVTAVVVCILTAGLNNYLSIFYIRSVEPGFVVKSELINWIAHTMTHLTVTILFTIIILIEHYINKEQQNQRIEKERLQYELNFLKSQINPHFMFNAINSIYFLMDKDLGQAKEVMLRFSSLLRYQLYECSSDQISLAQEIDFLNDYIEIEKMRNCENVEVHFERASLEKNHLLPPLLLIPFVENAFKYVSHYTDRLNYIHIDLGLTEENLLEFEIKNTFNPEPKIETHSSGLGIANVKRRLAILCPDNHSLVIGGVGDQFVVNLKIQLT
ncbi:histidine kinase [Flavobacterium sp. CYK-4]|uniref:sensor histidine kinase n=1 Tax=Flavobacterium lotistagni TaxID=2709660 RepID=UPI00140A93B2|nr:sensor histidine kinase [Flavobacterium lotistagni]NHM07281.1 histidine kinase [Flavobacterium lotistagni]